MTILFRVGLIVYSLCMILIFPYIVLVSVMRLLGFGDAHTAEYPEWLQPYTGGFTLLLYLLVLCSVNYGFVRLIHTNRDGAMAKAVAYSVITLLFGLLFTVVSPFLLYQLQDDSVTCPVKMEKVRPIDYGHTFFHVMLLFRLSGRLDQSQHLSALI
ncbi:hypothetical protein [Brevibacillus dissolubilis]|uniref:hypothetical protein n=1 Tax=Brevibacillus dissolubilis TaxID=1844116 RepID=UPI001115B12E|nr:hypothetical protein [Brevibacillus dissolubilis]